MAHEYTELSNYILNDLYWCGNDAYILIECLNPKCHNKKIVNKIKMVDPENAIRLKMFCPQHAEKGNKVEQYEYYDNDGDLLFFDAIKDSWIKEKKLI